MMRRAGRVSTFSIAVPEGPLPTEFRIFVKGWNSTEKGKFLFDDVAAKSVMSAYKKWGIDVPIDLEHQMLDLSGGEADPTARDARGWCKLELRNDGSLWAVGVKWTADGAARLSEKRQRYVSPAFADDEKTKRVLQVVNIAITALPATHHTPALVAASTRKKKMPLPILNKLGGLDVDHVQKALDALQENDTDAAMEILKAMIATAASGDPADATDPDGGGDDGAAEGVPPVEASEEPKVVEAGDADDDPDADDDKDDKKDPRKMAARALRSMLLKLTGKPTFAEALVEVGEYRLSHMHLETERTKLAAERATLESAERRNLVVSLVKLGAEFPATVWADDKATKIKPRWAKMPIEELRAHVADQRKARGAKPAPQAGAKPPPGEESTVELSAQELAICKETGCEPADFIRLRAMRNKIANDPHGIVEIREREANAEKQVSLGLAGHGSK